MKCTLEMGNDMAVNRWLKPLLLAALGLFAFAALPLHAQDTTSAIRGRIIDTDGQAIPGAQVVISDQRTGTSSTLQTGAGGGFNAGGLRVGGPYRVTVTSAHGDASADDIYLVLGDSYSLELTVGAAVTLEQVTVVGKAVTAPNTAIGPSASFGIADLASAPSVSRDIKDAIRADPRIYIDEAFADSIQCAGASSRFNSLTVDGVRLNDNFGLNSNGYPTERMPFSYDAIEQVSVELAPFDVQYGGFSACNINAVTKSGTNEFHGSLFYDYTDDSLTGDSLEGDSVDLGSFDEKRYGFTVGGPVIKNKLFFLASYEKLEGVDTFSRGPVGSGAGNEVLGVSQAQYDEILDIARTLYDYDPGGLPPSIPVEDEKFLVKLDWYITDTQRAAFTYNYNDGYHIAESDGDSDELEFSNHYYERGAELNAYVAQLFSDWTERFSTELKIGNSELQNRQLSLGGVDFGEVQIGTENNGSRATVYLGADDSRHANKLSYDTYNVKLAGEYLLGNHLITGGYELERLDVFNQFIQESEGEFRFSSIDDFRNGTPNRVIYENAAFTNVKDDAAANFVYDINSLYLQDEYRFDDLGLTLTGGLRYEWYATGDDPVENPAFASAYGFSNSQSVDGMSLLQPRLGFNWNVNDMVELHGGIGLYSGGNPNVWISNNYSNDGVTQIESSLFADDFAGTSLFDIPTAGDGRPVYDIPQELYDRIAAGMGSAGGVNSLDPDFDVPSEWKYALGAILYASDSLTFSLDYLYTDKQDAAIISDISREAVGETADGRTVYDSKNGRSQDFVLTNVDGDSGQSHILSFGLNKSFEFGLDVGFGYAYTRAEDVNPMTSSVAYSNYTYLATDDFENPKPATSNYEIPTRFTLTLKYDHAFVKDYLTKLSLFSSYNEGRPYSYTFTSGINSSVGDATFQGRYLLYMPSGLNDPNVVFGDDFDSAAFFAYADSHGLTEYAGRTVPRNDFYSDWWFKMDMKLEQELPGLRSDDRTSAFIVIKNLTNLINDDWGVQYEASFPRMLDIVDAEVLPDGRYQFNEFSVPTEQFRVTDSSLWEIRVGLRYEF